jgi:hypothetical protein
MQGPEGRPPNVSPARKGWEIDPDEDPSAVGAAQNRSSALPVSLGAYPDFLLYPTQGDENLSRPSNHSSRNPCPFLCHPEEPTCLRQVKGERCLQSRPRGPAPKISPARKGWVHKAGGRAPEVRHHTLRLFIPSVPGFPASQLSPVPLMWFSLKRTHVVDRSQLSTGNPGEPTCPGVPWRDLQFHGPFLEMFFDSASLTIVIPPVPACRGTEAQRSGGICVGMNVG